MLSVPRARIFRLEPSLIASIPHPRPCVWRDAPSQESYDPPIKLSSRLLTTTLPALLAPGPSDDADAVAAEALRLLVAILAGHKAVAGASAGPRAAAGVAAAAAAHVEQLFGGATASPAMGGHLRAFARKARARARNMPLFPPFVSSP